MIFASGEPVGPLPPVAGSCHVHLAEEPLQKFRPEIRVVEKRGGGVEPEAAGLWVHKKNFPLPLGLEQVPVGFEFRRVHELRVHIQRMPPATPARSNSMT